MRSGTVRASYDDTYVSVSIGATEVRFRHYDSSSVINFIKQAKARYIKAKTDARNAELAKALESITDV